ncbi:MAG: fumarate hydratase [Thermoprotei archaeon]
MVANQLREAIVEGTVEALKRAVTILPPDVVNALKRAYEEEISEAAKAQLKAILDNIEIARNNAKPICQDTGLIIYYVKAGVKFPLLAELPHILEEATRKATKEIPLRPNTVDPLTGKNPGDNTGRYVPYIHWELTSGDEVEIGIVPKGGGSEAVAMLRMPPPGKGVMGVYETVLDAVLSAGAKPCPPTIVGVGIGGGADIAVNIAKKQAVLRRIGEKNPIPELAKLEEKLYNAINELGIGVMGMGGNHTVLAVHVDYAYRHPATYPVAVVFQCWAARRAFLRVKPDGTYEISQ